MAQCIFCRIVKKQDPADIIYEDSDTVAFLDIHPRAPGHMMVIPKRHAKTIRDFSPHELALVFETVKKMTAALERAFQTDMATIGINHGELSGIPHLHIHIIPRFPTDGGGIIQGVVYNKPNKELDKIAEKIRRCL